MRLNIRDQSLSNKRFITLGDHLAAAEADESTYQSLQQQFRDRRAAARLGGEVRPGDYERIMADKAKA